MEESDFKIILTLPLTSCFTRVDGTLNQNDIVFMRVMESEVYFVRFCVSIFFERNPEFKQLTSNVLLNFRIITLGIRQVVLFLTGFKHVIGDHFDKIVGNKAFLNELVSVNLDLI
jgi:hypothetical protein